MTKKIFLPTYLLYFFCDRYRKQTISFFKPYCQKSHTVNDLIQDLIRGLFHNLLYFIHNYCSLMKFRDFVILIHLFVMSQCHSDSSQLETWRPSLPVSFRNYTGKSPLRIKYYLYFNWIDVCLISVWPSLACPWWIGISLKAWSPRSPRRSGRQSSWNTNSSQSSNSE